uniref:protein-serine/threonine phosphatase n=1 Tax=Tetradesmus obliquus TaxID=3088 RepID=A0A383WN56_TETOB|eukprot:jgi/Sobl393_1/19818/SZX78831.1
MAGRYWRVRTDNSQVVAWFMKGAECFPPGVAATQPRLALHQEALGYLKHDLADSTLGQYQQSLKYVVRVLLLLGLLPMLWAPQELVVCWVVAFFARSASYKTIVNYLKAWKYFLGVHGWDAQGRKPYMEDRHSLACLTPAADAHQAAAVGDWIEGVGVGSQLAYAGVFDGHGGSMTAAYAADSLHRLLQQHLHTAELQGHQGLSFSDCCQSAVSKAFLKADREWGEVTRGRPFDGSGSTAVVALVHKRNLVVGNAGDSVAVLARGGAALRLTELHRPDSEPEAERVLAAGGMLCQGKAAGSCLRVKQNPATLPAGERYARQPMLAVTRALGDYKMKRPSFPIICPDPFVAQASLNPADRLLLLASDGVTDVLTDDAMLEVALAAAEQAHARGEEGQEAAAAAAAAVQAAAIEAGTYDNVTALAMLLGWE